MFKVDKIKTIKNQIKLMIQLNIMRLELVFNLRFECLQ